MIDNIKAEMLRRTALDVAKRLRERAAQMRQDADAIEAQAERLESEA